MKLTEELEKIVTARVAMWDPEGDNMPELLTVIDGKLTVLLVAGIRNGFTDLGRALAPLAEKLAGRVTEYALIYTGAHARREGLVRRGVGRVRVSRQRGWLRVSDGRRGHVGRMRTRA